MWGFSRSWKVGTAKMQACRVGATRLLAGTSFVGGAKVDATLLNCHAIAHKTPISALPSIPPPGPPSTHKPALLVCKTRGHHCKVDVEQHLDRHCEPRARDADAPRVVPSRGFVRNPRMVDTVRTSATIVHRNRYEGRSATAAHSAITCAIVVPARVLRWVSFVEKSDAHFGAHCGAKE